MTTALHRKLLRELWHLKVQLVSIALVVAAGVMSVVTMRGTYEALERSRLDYYARQALADAWVSLVRAPESVARDIAAIPGVQMVDTRVNFLATLDVPGLDMPAQGRFVSVPDFGRPRLNDILLIAGRMVEPGASGEVVVSEKFASARGLGPGSTLGAILNGRARQLRIVGIAISPEHSYAVPPGAQLPEYDRYGVFWMSRAVLGPAYDMDGAFNELVLALDGTVSLAAVLARVDQLLEPYGGLGAYGREDQLSYFVLQNELAEIRTMGTVIPAIFLGVAVFLLHQVLGRMITTQRSEIALLKAFGYRGTDIAWHFLGFAMVAVLGGAVAGAAGGAWMGQLMVGQYQRYFELPDLRFQVSPSLFLFAVGLSFLGAGSGAMGAVWRAVRLPPADAMRPPAPPTFRPGPLERAGLGALLSPAAKLVLRNIERKPVQFGLSVTGVALSLSILVTGFFLFDSMDKLINTQFRVIQREDLMLTFREKLGEDVVHSLWRLPGVTRAETFWLAPARLRHGHLEEEVGVTGLHPGGRLRTVVDGEGRPLPLPASGLVLSALLARKLDVAPGDTLSVEWLDGERRRTELRVSGTSDDYLGLSAYISTPALAQATSSAVLASGAWLLADQENRPALQQQLKSLPAVVGVSSPQAMLDIYEEEMANSLLVSSAFLLGFAGIIACAVIYNGARIALSERSRELASLRVMGFHQREVATLLLGEQLSVTLCALPLGCALGYWMARGISSAMENDSYRIPLVLEPGTYLLACALVVAAALLSMLAVRQRLNRIELVSVLKTRE